jgi:hypothetical protein
VTLEITDPVVMRQNVLSSRDRRTWSELNNDGVGLSVERVSL